MTGRGGARPLRAPLRMGMVCSTRTDVDAILAYAGGLGAALRALHGITVSMILQRDSGWYTWTLAEPTSSEHDIGGLEEAVEDSDALVLHYNPFSWGPRGFAPELGLRLARLRLRRPELRIGIIAHERYVDMRGLRWTLMGAWQRLQFRAVLRQADAAFASTEAWTRQLRGQTRSPVAQIPICSNLPDRRAAREDSRDRLGLRPSSFVVAAFGTDHPSRLIDHIERAVAAIAETGRDVVLMNLGAGAPSIRPPDSSMRIIMPGPLSPTLLAEHLAAADLYLSPFADGVSARRTSLMSALQHGLPVVGTDGIHTDSFMREAGDALLLTPSYDPAAFATAARSLAAQPAQRARRGAAGRRLYESRCDWPVACRVALDSLALRIRPCA